MSLLAKKPDFETAVRPELPTLYRVARRLSATVEEAEDLVQQALVKAFSAWRRFDGRHLRSWLIRIMRNVRANQLRRPESRMDTSPLEDGPDTRPLWDDLCWRDEANRILEELERLPMEFKMAVHLCDVEELTYEEAARAMEVPIGTIRSRLSRGRAMIRARLCSTGKPLGDARP